MQPRPDHGEESYQGSGRLNGKKVLITGGDSGIGRAVAIAYAREGADVAINYLPDEEEDAREVVELIQKAGRNVAAIPGDIRDETFCQTLVNQAVDALGGLDILVNNAGRQQFCESIDDLTTEAFDATFKTNVYATFWITKAALRHLSSGSVIINTTSVQAYEPSDILLDYAQTKAAIASSPNRWRNNWRRRGFGLTPSRRVPTGRCCSAAEVSHRKKSRNLARSPRLVDPVNRRRSHRCMSRWRHQRTATRPVRSGVQTVAPGPYNARFASQQEKCE